MEKYKGKICEGLPAEDYEATTRTIVEGRGKRVKELHETDLCHSVYCRKRNRSERCWPAVIKWNGVRDSRNISTCIGYYAQAWGRYAYDRNTWICRCTHWWHYRMHSVVIYSCSVRSRLTAIELLVAKDNQSLIQVFTLSRSSENVTWWSEQWTVEYENRVSKMIWS